MTKGEGLVSLLYALKGILEAGVIWVITGFAVLAFFWLIITFIAGKAGFKNIPYGPSKPEDGGKRIMYALFLLFVIFAIYSLIALTGAVFGVNNGPAGGLQIR